MFTHAADSFRHGLEHYFDETERSRKFALLHIDHAIELILKEKVIDLGKSIYKADGKTLTIHEALRSVEKEVSIPELPRLEELHDLRNVIQHKGVLPDKTTTDFYIRVAYNFTKRFIKSEFGLGLNSILSPQQIAIFEAPQPRNLPKQVSDAIIDAFSNENNMTKIIGLHTALEIVARHMVSPTNETEKVSVKKTLQELAKKQGNDENKFSKRFKYIDILRGQIMHSEHMPNDKEVEGYWNTIQYILTSAGFKLDEFENITKSPAANMVLPKAGLNGFD